MGSGGCVIHPYIVLLVVGVGVGVACCWAEISGENIFKILSLASFHLYKSWKLEYIDPNFANIG